MFHNKQVQVARSVGNIATLTLALILVEKMFHNKQVHVARSVGIIATLTPSLILVEKMFHNKQVQVARYHSHIDSSTDTGREDVSQQTGTGS